MIVSDITKCIEHMAPLAYQEGYDNAGLCVGRPDMPVTAVLLCFDVTEVVLDEAIQRGANLIISHHPVIFSGLKRLRGNTDTERIVIKAIKHDIALYAAHTNLDSVQGGISWRMAQMLGLENIQILSPLKNQLVKLVTFVPTNYIEPVRTAMFQAGAGHIGLYDQCSFSLSGEGTFRASDTAQPFVGNIGEQHREPETRLETIAQRKDLGVIVQALQSAHPYQEVAYDVYPIDNVLPTVGMGAVGNLATPCVTDHFFERVKWKFNVQCLRSNKPFKQVVTKVAVCGGSGSGLMREAIAAKADVLITGDCKYHQFIDAGQQIMLADIGHFESESFAVDVFSNILSENFPNFAVYSSNNSINPVIYH